MIPKINNKKTSALNWNMDKENILPNSKRSQVTIFIIVGVLIIAGIALFFLFRQGVIPTIGEKTTEKPASFLDSCVEEKVRNTINTISEQGGYMKNDLNIKLDGEEISFLC